MNLSNWLSYSKDRQRYPVDSTIGFPDTYVLDSDYLLDDAI